MRNRGLGPQSSGPAGPARSLIHGDDILVRVVAPHFVAGLIMSNGLCTEAAPILRRRAIGKTRDQLRASFARLGWIATILLPKTQTARHLTPGRSSP